MWAKPLTEEIKEAEGGETDDLQETEYTFEGFTVEFSEKIMLTPVAASDNAQVKGQVGV